MGLGKCDPGGEWGGTEERFKYLIFSGSSLVT